MAQADKIDDDLKTARESIESTAKKKVPVSGREAAVAGKAASGLVNLKKYSAMGSGGGPGGRAYIVTELPGGKKWAFYKSSGEAYKTMGRPWVPFGGVTSQVVLRKGRTNISNIGLWDVARSAAGDLKNHLGKLSNKDPRSLKWVDPETGVVTTGKYLEPSSDLGKVASALEDTPLQGAAAIYKSSEDFLSKNIKSISGGADLDTIWKQINRGFKQMGEAGVSKQYLRDWSINYQLYLDGALNLKKTKNAHWHWPGFNGDGPTTAKILKAASEGIDLGAILRENKFKSRILVSIKASTI